MVAWEAGIRLCLVDLKSFQCFAFGMLAVTVVECLWLVQSTTLFSFEQVASKHSKLMAPLTGCKYWELKGGRVREFKAVSDFSVKTLKHDLSSTCFRSTVACYYNNCTKLSKQAVGYVSPLSDGKWQNRYSNIWPDIKYRIISI